MKADEITVRRKSTPDPPRGWQNFRWYGPGLVWMISAVGSGSVLFTPRVGARYGYEFVWITILFFFFMFMMIREVGRYTVTTGKTIFEGYRDLSGKSNWALYFILVPQMLAAVVTISGIASLTASALMIALPWSHEAYAASVIMLGLVLVLTGNYKMFERVLSILAAILVAVVVVSGIRVFSNTNAFVNGLVPHIPSNTDVDFIVPWVGFILAGASGIMWFSYWVAAREYGGSVTKDDDIAATAKQNIGDDIETNRSVYARLKRWLRVMSVTALIGVAGGGLVLLSFLVLGTELLKPEGVIPEGIAVAKDLSKLLSEVWGSIGKWLLLIGMSIALLGTILSAQDGYGRMFADGVTILSRPVLRRKNILRDNDEIPESLSGYKRTLGHWLIDAKKLKRVFALVLGGIIPLIVFFIVKDPVKILSVAGTVAAVHTPVVVFLTLKLNRSRLPQPLRPGKFATAVMWVSGIAYGAFAVFNFV